MTNLKIKIVKDISKIDPGILGEGVALYVRVTREESIKQGLSVPNQCNRGLEVATYRGWKWVKLYVEPKHVGAEFWTDKRSALKELIKDLKSGKIRRVFARHQDRFWRSSEIRDKLLAIFKRYNVELWDFDGLKDYKTASGRFALKVQADASEYEKDITAERIREMKRGKAIAGQPGGGPAPFGYMSQDRLKRMLMKYEGLSSELAYQQACGEIPNQKEWFPYLPEAEAILVIASAYLFMSPSLVSSYFKKFDSKIQKKIRDIFAGLKSPMGSLRIAQLLNAHDYHAMNREPWSGAKVLRILNNPVYFGFMTYDEIAYKNKQPASRPKRFCKFFPATHAPIIHPGVWENVQMVKSRNTVNLRTKSKSGAIYPLSKIISCGKCQSLMRATSQGRKRPYAYYVCRNRIAYGADTENNPRACDFPRINVRNIEESVWKYLESLAGLVSNDVVIHWKEMIKKWRSRLPEKKEKYQQVKKDQIVIQQLIQKYYSKFETSLSPGEEELAWQKLIELKTKQDKLSCEEKDLHYQLSCRMVRDPEALIRRNLEVLRKIMRKQAKDKKTAYRILIEKYNFRVLAHEQYLVESQIEIDVFRRKRKINLADSMKELTVFKLSKKIDIKPFNFISMKEWVKKQQDRHICFCGCGNPIQIRPRHRSKGIPKYRYGHHTVPMTSLVEKYNKNGFYTVAQVSKMLGISQTSIRRYQGKLFPEPALVVHKNKMRLFTKRQIEIIMNIWTKKTFTIAGPENDTV